MMGYNNKRLICFLSGNVNNIQFLCMHGIVSACIPRASIDNHRHTAMEFFLTKNLLVANSATYYLLDSTALKKVPILKFFKFRLFVITHPNQQKRGPIEELIKNLLHQRTKFPENQWKIDESSGKRGNCWSGLKTTNTIQFHRCFGEASMEKNATQAHPLSKFDTQSLKYTTNP